MLPLEQMNNIKNQILFQLEQSNTPNKEEIKESIQKMNSGQLEEFLKQNNLIQSGQTPQEIPLSQQCIFCSIISDKIQSYKIDENKNSIAILEINPISKAHTIIIPKEHISSSEKLPQTIFSLAKKISKKIQTRYKPKEVVIASANLFGHEIVNVFPVYENETINSKRTQANPEDLIKLQNQLKAKKKIPSVKKPQTKKIQENLWLPKRIP